MGKDLKEKFEKVCNIKDTALCLVESQISGDISSVDAKELGEVMDIAKDAAELIKYCTEAEYYHKVVESMDEASSEEKSYYMNKYIPEYDGKFYTPMTRRRFMYTEPYYRVDPGYDDRYDESYRNRMYYSSVNISDGNDYRYGKSYIARRGYMEAKEHGDKDHSMKELERYMSSLSEDMAEMISGMSSDEKVALKQKLATLASKIS